MRGLPSPRAFNEQHRMRLPTGGAPELIAAQTLCCLHQCGVFLAGRGDVPFEAFPVGLPSPEHLGQQRLTSCRRSSIVRFVARSLPDGFPGEGKGRPAGLGIVGSSRRTQFVAVVGYSGGSIFRFDAAVRDWQTAYRAIPMQWEPFLCRAIISGLCAHVPSREAQTGEVLAPRPITSRNLVVFLDNGHAATPRAMWSYSRQQTCSDQLRRS